MVKFSRYSFYSRIGRNRRETGGISTVLSSPRVPVAWFRLCLYITLSEVVGEYFALGIG